MTDERKVIAVDFKAKRLLSEAETTEIDGTLLTGVLKDGSKAIYIMPDGKKLLVAAGANGDLFVGFPLLQVHDGTPYSYAGFLSESDRKILAGIFEYLQKMGLVIT